MYYIKNEKGYFLPNGYGYTKDKAQAGVFGIDELDQFVSLDGCTLYQAEELKDPNSPDITFILNRR